MDHVINRRRAGGGSGNAGADAKLPVNKLPGLTSLQYMLLGAEAEMGDKYLSNPTWVQRIEGLFAMTDVNKDGYFQFYADSSSLILSYSHTPCGSLNQVIGWCRLRAQQLSADAAPIEHVGYSSRARGARRSCTTQLLSVVCNT